MKKFTFEDYKLYRAVRSKEFNNLIQQVIDSPKDWTEERFIVSYRALPKTTKTKGGTKRGKSYAKKEWKNLQLHGII